MDILLASMSVHCMHTVPTESRREEMPSPLELELKMVGNKYGDMSAGNQINVLWKSRAIEPFTAAISAFLNSCQLSAKHGN